jgi:PPOX class probable F420-dependent enzyme
MAAFPPNYLDLTEKAAFASLATLMPDGTPQVTPVWFDYANGLIRVNTATGRVKAQNMREGAAVALSILDPQNPYRYVQVRGTVSRTTRDGADAQHLPRLRQWLRRRRLSASRRVRRAGPEWPKPAAGSYRFPRTACP